LQASPPQNANKPLKIFKLKKRLDILQQQKKQLTKAEFAASK